MFWIFLASTLISKNMFFSSFIVGFEKLAFKTYYNALIVRDTSAILVVGTALFQEVGAKNYFYISFIKTLLVFNV
jgi:hypothetical protein